MSLALAGHFLSDILNRVTSPQTEMLKIFIEEEQAGLFFIFHTCKTEYLKALLGVLFIHRD